MRLTLYNRSLYEPQVGSAVNSLHASVGIINRSLTAGLYLFNILSWLYRIILLKANFKDNYLEFRYTLMFLLEIIQCSGRREYFVLSCHHGPEVTTSKRWPPRSGSSLNEELTFRHREEKKGNFLVQIIYRHLYLYLETGGFPVLPDVSSRGHINFPKASLIENTFWKPIATGC